MKKSEENRIFAEAVIVEKEQTADGIYCTGCMTVHKRPTKMYENGRDVLCRFQVVELYNPELP